MDEIKKKYGSIETAFNKFVVENGGELVSERLELYNHRPKNADYLFSNVGLIVELKTLEKNHFKNEDGSQNQSDNYAALDRIQKEEEKGFITREEIEEWQNTGEPSEAIMRVIYRDALKPTIENALSKARKQIKETREFLKIPKFFGFVFFANDKNEFPPVYIEKIINELVEKNNQRCLIEKNYHGRIDGFVLFSTNREMALESKPENTIYWMGYNYISNRDVEARVSDFIDDLGIKWSGFVAKETGGSLRSKLTTDQQAETISRMTYIPRSSV